MFPDNGNTRLRWDEPRLFALRLISTTGWAIRRVIALVIFAVFFGLMSLDNNSLTAPEFGLATRITLPAIIAVFFIVMFEVPNLQRTVSINDKNIFCNGKFMMFGGEMFHPH
jgi:hypothetical protein